MTDERQPDDDATIEEIDTPAWDRATTLSQQAPASDGAPAVDASARPSRRSGVRWIVALLGIVIVVAGSALIVTLAGGRPASSIALGYMPAATVAYTEVRLDLPGDQRQKLAAFLKPIPGFSDQSQIEPKLNDVLDRLMRAATSGKQTWTADIAPWFTGQIAAGTTLPDPALMSGGGAGSMNDAALPLAVATITDRTKAIAWVTSTADAASLNRTTYNGADLFTSADRQSGAGFPGTAIAVTDKVLITGSETAVKAAVDSNGNGSLAQDDGVKAAMATVDRDYVVLSVTRLRAYAEWATSLIEQSQPGTLAGTQLDETVLGILPAWSVSFGRFDDNQLTMVGASPPWAIGYDATNRAGTLVGHVPAKSFLYLDAHDAGPALTALLAKFRALPEAKPAFDQIDQALSVLGGSDAVYGWWGDVALVVTPLENGTIGAGLVIKPRDAAAADRLVTTLNGFVALAGANAGVTSHTEDHNGTKITTVDASQMTPPGSLPAGYKSEVAWATNADVTVLGYGHDFVAAVLDSGNGTSLGSDPRFTSLQARVGSDGIATAFVDLAGIREFAEPLLQQAVPAEKWSMYTTEIKPYLEHIDAMIQTVRSDGGVNRASSAVTLK